LELNLAIKAILFDKDGTLIDFEATFNPATAVVIKQVCNNDQALIRQVAETVGFDLASETIRDDSPIIAGTGMDQAGLVAPLLGIDDVPKFAIELDKLFGAACIETVVELPGIRDTLNQLGEQGYTLGVATNDSEANGIGQMEKLEFAPKFVRILGADSGYGQKPQASMVSGFISEFGFKPEEVIMVGDSTHDLEAGRAAGAVTCAVLTGPAKREALEPFADIILSSAAELSAYLSND